jgi:hypothetical protein
VTAKQWDLQETPSGIPVPFICNLFATFHLLETHSW